MLIARPEPFALALAAAGLWSAQALGQESAIPKSPAPTAAQLHCQTLGEGFFAVEGSDACVRISGYVSTGIGFANPLTPRSIGGPFGARPSTSASSSTTQVGARIETELGPGRLYVQFGGHNSWPGARIP